jgi:hypothetical protein
MMVTVPRPLQREQKIIRHIRRNAPTVLFDRKAPLRDKAAICWLLCGMGCFRLSWVVFLHLFKKRPTGEAYE